MATTVGSLLRTARHRASRGSRKARALTCRAMVTRGAGDVSTQWLTRNSDPAIPPRLGSQLAAAASSAAVREVKRRLLHHRRLVVDPRRAARALLGEHDDPLVAVDHLAQRRPGPASTPTVDLV